MRADAGSFKTFLEPKVHEGKSGNDKIEFSFSVLLSARDMLQELVKMQTYQDITDSSYPQIQAEMQEVKSKIYFWKSNPENNIKMLRQSFSNPPEEEEGKKGERNLLGIKRNKSWLEEFTIAKIMFMTPLNYLEFSDCDNLIFEFNHRNIIEKVPASSLRSSFSQSPTSPYRLSCAFWRMISWKDVRANLQLM